MNKKNRAGGGLLSGLHHVPVLSALQENILQKVVMTAFADRTVVTIAVSPSGFFCCY